MGVAVNFPFMSSVETRTNKNTAKTTLLQTRIQLKLHFHVWKLMDFAKKQK